MRSKYIEKKRERKIFWAMKRHQGEKWGWSSNVSVSLLSSWFIGLHAVQIRSRGEREIEKESSENSHCVFGWDRSPVGGGSRGKKHGSGEITRTGFIWCGNWQLRHAVFAVVVVLAGVSAARRTYAFRVTGAVSSTRIYQGVERHASADFGGQTWKVKNKAPLKWEKYLSSQMGFLISSTSRSKIQFIF